MIFRLKKVSWVMYVYVIFSHGFASFLFVHSKLSSFLYFSLDISTYVVPLHLRLSKRLPSGVSQMKNCYCWFFKICLISNDYSSYLWFFEGKQTRVIQTVFKDFGFLLNINWDSFPLSFPRSRPYPVVQGVVIFHTSMIFRHVHSFNSLASQSNSIYFEIHPNFKQCV